MTPNTRSGLMPQAGELRGLPGDEALRSGAGLVRLEGVDYCGIADVHRMAPFFMAIPSASDLWMYVSSRGALSAGRVSPEGALFPYETVDRIHDARGQTGGVTVLRVSSVDHPTTTWEPFSAAFDADERVRRNVYKSVTGDRVVFEEIRTDLGLSFRSAWQACDDLGIVRSATLARLGERAVRIELIDGLVNVMPSGVPLELMRRTSCLVDAYRRTECDGGTGLALYTLTSKIMDRPEAGEVLRANTVWSTGLDGARYSVDEGALDVFRRGLDVPPANLAKGKRGAYLLRHSLGLDSGGVKTWHIIGDVNRSHVEVAALRARLREGAMARSIPTALFAATRDLRRLIAETDGTQLTGDRAACVHHFANTLFNDMRGGVFADGHAVSTADFSAFLDERNPALAERHRATLDDLPQRLDVGELLGRVRTAGDVDLERLSYEYLPLHFGRRHGDPSRPWNSFAIRAGRGGSGTRLGYEGNWRDIFQNWEALALSHPAFAESMVAKFLNATTIDGFNPARLDRSGVGWDEPDPDDPWSTIGYWNDHQIVYLTRLMEMSRNVRPGWLEEMLDRQVFSHAAVPYRIAPYGEIVADPHDSIRFEKERADAIRAREATAGTDARLVQDADGNVVHVTMTEKLLILALAKMSNLVVGGGIWMNTQRPEWNDANNVLAGNGLSVVTTGYLRRHLALCREILAARGGADLRVLDCVGAWMRDVADVLRTCDADALTDDRRRREVLDGLGAAFSAYRTRAYAGDVGERTAIPAASIDEFFELSLDQLDATLTANRRSDGLYHGYNVLDLHGAPGTATIKRLNVMLEGQVSVLSSGVLSSAETVDVLERMFTSPLYREDQSTFMLQPWRDVPGFFDRNVVDTKGAEAIGLLAESLAAGDDRIVARDADGVVRFHGDFSGAADLAARLDELAEDAHLAPDVERDREAVLALFEEVFQHHDFTGRSERMYAYEGLGCIYWHMVAKLLLAVQECHERAAENGDSEDVVQRLADLYFRVRSGLGFEKSAREYGAFPCDPYSHTAADGVARQPGMTGQVKEEVITRFGELGVVFRHGRVAFRPRLLRRREFFSEATVFEVEARDDSPSVAVPAKGLAFTLCGTPVTYALVPEGRESIRVVLVDGGEKIVDGVELDAESSSSLLGRNGEIARLEVSIPESCIKRP